MRKMPLKRGAPPQPKWPPQGAREKRAKRLSRSKMPTTVADAVHRRSGGRCEFGPHPGCPGPGEHLHHRKLRSAGGENTAENLVDVCHIAHHELIHGNQTWARHHGWIVSRYRDPADVPFLVGCDPDCEIDHIA